jgi:hypothetical protein
MSATGERRANSLQKNTAQRSRFDRFAGFTVKKKVNNRIVKLTDKRGEA